MGEQSPIARLITITAQARVIGRVVDRGVAGYEAIDAQARSIGLFD
jgi:hypothetical protein